MDGASGVGASRYVEQLTRYAPAEGEGRLLAKVTGEEPGDGQKMDQDVGSSAGSWRKASEPGPDNQIVTSHAVELLPLRL